uniref:Putative product n=1 Tax=Xenopsylla cheopis TaxID=163159 RepID=A0A6M2DZT5_XENCH
MLSSHMPFFLVISFIALTISDFSMHSHVSSTSINFSYSMSNIVLLFRFVEFFYVLFPHVKNFLVTRYDCSMFLIYAISFCSLVLCPSHFFGRLEHQV